MAAVFALTAIRSSAPSSLALVAGVWACAASASATPPRCWPLYALGLGLLELPLGGQRIVAGHRAGNLLRLALHRIDQTLTCLVSLVVFESF